MSDTTHDVIIIGGSYAGLSAALQLARARRKVLIIDEGLRRNRFAAQAHGFLTQDGVDPAAIAATARAQVMAYPSVAWVTGRAQTARKVDGATSGAAIFEVTVGDSSHRGRRLILAPGVRDILPRIEGLQERWGKSVFHCPYCHGYELDRGRIGVIAGSEMSLHQALMLPDWGPTTLLLNAALTPEARQLEALADRGITVEPMPVTAIRGHADVLLADGQAAALGAVDVG
ncbi:MAG: FAD-dependent oxidoreductase, partial [Halothiobacillaceae bacterium]